MLPKSFYLSMNESLKVPMSPMKAKQERLLGKLNRMMGKAKSGLDEGENKRRLSWEDIPLVVGG